MSQQEANTVAFAIQKKTGFLIHGSTGCSCCQSDNILHGIKDTHDEALEEAMSLHSRKAVCSQYSANGHYTIRKVDYEILPDGRILLEDRVFPDAFIYTDGYEANALRYAGEQVDSLH